MYSHEIIGLFTETQGEIHSHKLKYTQYENSQLVRQNSRFTTLKVERHGLDNSQQHSRIVAQYSCGRRGQY